jgi:hypothetical protein
MAAFHALPDTLFTIVVSASLFTFIRMLLTMIRATITAHACEIAIDPLACIWIGRVISPTNHTNVIRMFIS